MNGVASHELTTDRAAATEALAEELGRVCQGGELILLDGELGAGKTTFVRGLARGLEADARRVKSPSYTLHHRHAGRRILHHLDVYFTDSALDLERTPVREYLAQGDVVVVEWGSRFASDLPQDRLEVALEHEAETERKVHFSANGPGAAELLGRLCAECDLP